MSRKWIQKWNHLQFINIQEKGGDGAGLRSDSATGQAYPDKKLRARPSNSLKVQCRFSFPLRNLINFRLGKVPLGFKNQVIFQIVFYFEERG